MISFFDETSPALQSCCTRGRPPLACLPLPTKSGRRLRRAKQLSLTPRFSDGGEKRVKETCLDAGPFGGGKDPLSNEIQWAKDGPETDVPNWDLGAPDDVHRKQDVADEKKSSQFPNLPPTPLAAAAIGYEQYIVNQRAELGDGFGHGDIVWSVIFKRRWQRHIRRTLLERLRSLRVSSEGFRRRCLRNRRSRSARTDLCRFARLE